MYRRKCRKDDEEREAENSKKWKMKEGEEK
jgi:hypothetical protein